MLEIYHKWYFNFIGVIPSILECWKIAFMCLCVLMKTVFFPHVQACFEEMWITKNDEIILRALSPATRSTVHSRLYVTWQRTRRFLEFVIKFVLSFAVLMCHWSPWGILECIRWPHWKIRWYRKGGTFDVWKCNFEKRKNENWQDFQNQFVF